MPTDHRRESASRRPVGGGRRRALFAIGALASELARVVGPDDVLEDAGLRAGLGILNPGVIFER